MAPELVFSQQTLAALEDAVGFDRFLAALPGDTVVDAASATDCYLVIYLASLGIRAHVGYSYTHVRDGGWHVRDEQIRTPAWAREFLIDLIAEPPRAGYGPHQSSMVPVARAREALARVQRKRGLV